MVTAIEYKIHFIDARLDTLSLGQIQKGLLNRVVTAGFEQPLSAVLNELVEQPTIVENAPLLYIKINKLKISERTTASREMASCEIIADFIAEDGDGYLLLDQQAIMLSNPGIDVTASHGQNIIDGLKQLLRQFTQNNRPLKIAVDKNELLQATKYSNQDLAILTVQNPNKGLYFNFLEYRNNQPGETKDYEAIVHGKADAEFQKIKIRSSSNGKVMHDLWGFSDGRHAYIKIGHDFFRLSTENDSITFLMSVYDPNYGALVAGGLLGGMIGGAIVGALADGHDQLTLYLDPVNGEYSQINSGKTSDENLAHLIFFRNEKSNELDNYDILLNGDQIGTISSHKEIVELRIPLMEVSALFEGSAGQSIIFDQIEEGTIYIQSTTKGKEEIFKLLSKDQASYHLQIIRNYQKRQK
ncbi:MAG: hypothetical protein IPL46_00140 [Saprospiraceae bacterium]|nr:hypothetical protein [Saprospiraceae bacterium]